MCVQLQFSFDIIVQPKVLLTVTLATFLRISFDLNITNKKMMFY